MKKRKINNRINKKSLPICALCESEIENQEEVFVLEEKIIDRQNCLAHVEKTINPGAHICYECLVDLIDDTQLLIKTSPQVSYFSAEKEIFKLW